MKEIEDFGFDELLKAAAKSEVNAREVYVYIADDTENFVIKDRFNFLADEEQKHEEYIRDLYETRNNKELDAPDETPVPIPFINYGEDVSNSEILEQAMDAEIASRDFYRKMSEIGEEDIQEDIVKLLNYLADMEQNHYEILKSEFERAKEFEEFDEYHPGMHVGP